MTSIGCICVFFFFFQAEDGIRDIGVTGVQTCALPICGAMLVVERAPGHQSGSRYDLSTGATLGRGDVEIVLEDPFASSRHARIERQGGVMVIEDLGSTNGT